MNVSFDFDNTLLRILPDEDFGLIEDGPNEPVLEKLREHASAGDTVFIVTSRFSYREEAYGRTSVANFVAQHKLPVTRIVFTQGAPKVGFLEHLGVTKHFDDDIFELDALQGTGIQGVLIS